METLVAAIDDQIGDGSSFADVAAARKLAVVTTPAITAGGVSPEQPAYQAPAELRPLLANAFTLTPGEDPTVEAVPGTDRYALIAVDRIVAAAPPPLAAIRPQVLLMDEWFLAGDAAFMDRAKVRLEDMVRGAEILVLSSHAAPVILDWCTRVIWLDKGRIGAYPPVRSPRKQDRQGFR